MAFIEWIEENEASGELAEIYRRWRGEHPGREQVPDILKCFSPNPLLLEKIIAAIYPLHFQDGALPCRIKEMIATFVSGLNRCPY